MNKRLPAKTTLVPFTNLPKRTQYLLWTLFVTVIFATVFFAATDASIASIP